MSLGCFLSGAAEHGLGLDVLVHHVETQMTTKEAYKLLHMKCRL